MNPDQFTVAEDRATFLAVLRARFAKMDTARREAFLADLQAQHNALEYAERSGRVLDATREMGA